jgi:predicted nucleic acid-binding protein
VTFVLDASVAMSWCFEDEATAQTEALLDRVGAEGALVPTIWFLEVANVLLVAERRGRLTDAQATRFTALLHQLPLETAEAHQGLEDLLGWGRRYSLSSYDASYFGLAETSGLPLATLDARLSEAALKAGVQLLLAP